MRIAVISDTHDHCPPQLPRLLAHADEIWHLGDVSIPDTLREISRPGQPLHIVQGNCDFEPWPHSIRRSIHGVRCHLVHIPPLFLPPDCCHLLLHGHTHIPRDETIGGIRWLNPGSVSQPRGGHRPGFAWLVIEPGKPPEWTMQWLAKD